MPRLVFPDDVRPDFPGFGRAGFAFLRDLAGNNDRGWFHANKETYEAELRFPMECLVAEFASDRGGKDLPVRGDPARGVFRIHRDIRFSKNKSPYKTHIGAVLSRSGGRGDQGGVYIHIQPGNCFVSAGFWRPRPDMLTRWRSRMAEDPERWLAAVRPAEERSGKTYMRTISALKTLPRGFRDREGSAVENYLKWKSFLMTCPVTQHEAGSRDLVGIVRTHAIEATPLLRFGWEIADDPAGDDPRRHMRGGDALVRSPVDRRPADDDL